MHETEGQLALTQVLDAPLSDGEFYLNGALPELALVARLNSAGVTQHYTINDYDLRAQP